MGLLVLRGVVLGVLRDVSELARLPNAVRNLPALVGREKFDLLLELLVPLGRENDFLQNDGPPETPIPKWPGHPASGGCGWYLRAGMNVNSAWQLPGYDAPMSSNLRESWWIRDVEIPTRVVLAPMAGVSVQAFRRQGRRHGAGLVCSEMVSCAGIEHRNERTLGYLRVASDEHPLAIQIFGSDRKSTRLN